MARQSEFFEIVSAVAREVEERELDARLEAWLNDRFPANGDQFSHLSALCPEGEKEGWLLNREAGGIKFCRAVKPGKEAGRFSVDVVRIRISRGRIMSTQPVKLAPSCQSAASHGSMASPRAGTSIRRAPAITQRLPEERPTSFISCQKERLNSPANKRLER